MLDYTKKNSSNGGATWVQLGKICLWFSQVLSLMIFIKFDYHLSHILIFISHETFDNTTSTIGETLALTCSSCLLLIGAANEDGSFCIQMNQWSPEFIISPCHQGFAGQFWIWWAFSISLSSSCLWFPSSRITSNFLQCSLALSIAWFLSVFYPAETPCLTTIDISSMITIFRLLMWFIFQSLTLSDSE